MGLHLKRMSIHMEFCICTGVFISMTNSFIGLEVLYLHVAN
jgi:hypothetical protein